LRLVISPKGFIGFFSKSGVFSNNLCLSIEQFEIRDVIDFITTS